MKASFTFLAATSVALMMTACTKTEDAPTAEVPEATEVQALEPTAAEQGAGYTLPPAAAAFVATLSAQELGMARLSCIEPIRTAKAYTKNFDADLAAELEAAPYMSITDVLTKTELKMDRRDAMAVMNASPTFAPSDKPKPEDVEGLKQCVLIAKHLEAELKNGAK